MIDSNTQNINIDNNWYDWISITKKLPPEQVDVLIRVKNKNKPDGIYLYDICRYFHKEGTWADDERQYTWETITDWKYINFEDYLKYEK